MSISVPEQASASEPTQTQTQARHTEPTAAGMAMANELAEQTRDQVDRVEAPPRRARPWQRYLEANLGLREYWYPAALSDALPEGGTHAVKMLGEEILLVRKNGKLYAVEDRCAHRGTRFSERPLVLSEDTITCWYHTWTFDMENGDLRCILNEPESSLVGRTGVRAYPVVEAKGLLFVYIGDEEPPPLEADVPASFLAADTVMHYAEPGIIRANWRLALENSFDPGHHFIHNWSPYVIESGFPMTFGYVAKKGEEAGETTYVVDAPGPKGFSRCTATAELIFSAVIPGKDGRPDTTYTAPAAVGKSREELISSFLAMPPIEVGIWLPSCNETVNFPSDMITFDWLVPIDENHTRSFMFGAKSCSTEEEAEAWRGETGRTEWYVPTVEKFLIDDNKARESMQTFYEKENGWDRERLYRPDLEITMFRKFFSEHARDIQTPDKLIKPRSRRNPTRGRS
ncbi:Rieske 2Fe-2S domain-containing protein [Parafrankia sp. EUN1f]|uniref:Rieske 2Fe-2S domain-containing protein n=1 Tax=Parafrankia sp. EUN1f TaxID=102897 RepID=UPI0001C44AEC|nr:Rieske 2Fe-2S domain-containing protein [Parafrankia sp. EUN1f]EFC82920.1 Rieske (2Fe-2S) domain protein [Parafrankia sp. EUN1f]